MLERRDRTYIVRGVRVVVHAAEECRRRVFANVLGEQVRTTRVRVEERRHVVDEAGHQDKRARRGLLLDCKKGK